MISATEKAKRVLILNRDAAANLTISSQLEAHKNAAITLEVDYTESNQDPTGKAFNKVCSYSSCCASPTDQHVVCKWSCRSSLRADVGLIVPSECCDGLEVEESVSSICLVLTGICLCIVHATARTRTFS